MKKLNLLLVLVFVVSFVMLGCQQPPAPKAKTPAKAVPIAPPIVPKK